MAKITREQYMKWNEQAKKGFRFDLEYFLTWGEKTLIKDIKQNDGTIIRFNIYYMPEYETIINDYGCKWNKRTGKQIPSLRVDKLLPCSTKGMFQVITVKECEKVGDPQKNKNYSVLCKISERIKTEELLKEIS